MAHNSVQILDSNNQHSHYTDWLTARGLIETGLAIENERTPSGNRVRSVRMVSARKVWNKVSWSPRQSGYAGPLVMQMDR